MWEADRFQPSNVKNDYWYFDCSWPKRIIDIYFPAGKYRNMKINRSKLIGPIDHDLIIEFWSGSLLLLSAPLGISAGDKTRNFFLNLSIYYSKSTRDAITTYKYFIFHIQSFLFFYFWNFTGHKLFFSFQRFLQS